MSKDVKRAIRNVPSLLGNNRGRFKFLSLTQIHAFLVPQILSGGRDFAAKKKEKTTGWFRYLDRDLSEDGTQGSPLTTRVRASVYDSILPAHTLKNWQSFPTPPVPRSPSSSHQSPHFSTSMPLMSFPFHPYLYANTSSSHYLMSRPFQGPLARLPSSMSPLPPPHYSSRNCFHHVISLFKTP